MARAKKTIEDVQFCCRVTPLMHDKISLVARTFGVSMGVLISNAVDEYLEKNKEEFRRRLDITLSKGA